MAATTGGDASGGTGDDEFALLAQGAAARGLDAKLPRVRRVPLGGDEGDAGGRPGALVSGLAWGEAPRRVALLHGAGLGAHTWDTTLLHWGVPALALDLPGHGESSWLADGRYSPGILAGRVGSALDLALAAGALEAPLTLVGQSLGGLTALELAAAREDVAELILVDILPEAGDAEPSFQALAAILDGPAEFDSRETLVQMALSLGLGGTDPEGVRRAVTLNTRVLPDGRVEWKHQLARLRPGDLSMGDAERQWEELAGLPSRVDLVLGARGVVSQAQVGRLRASRPEARVVSLDAGHNIQEDAPEDLARALAGLLPTP
jgi:pimeloyl-ACP methyl ester carboxylesterase